MYTRRKFLTTSAIAAAGLGLAACRDAAQAQAPTASATAAAGPLNTRAIPSTGERIPVIGMGTSGSFEVGQSSVELDPLREVLKRFFAAGATLIDSAPTYSVAEDVMGILLAEQGLTTKAWLATKLSGVTGREAGMAQFEDTLRRLKTDKVALLQVHNLGDLKTQMAVARELKAQGKVKYVGVTHYVERAQDELADVVQAEKPDFLQINYSVASRGAEKRVLPLAQDLGVAVLINRAFEDGKLFAEVKDKPVPPVLTEAGVTSWAQAFLKFALSHPAVTAVIPATGKPDRQTDNLKAGVGPDLTSAQRDALIAALA
ncbi:MULTISPECIES: aldo/keto reductase [unclassified Pseudoxanthomonas]|uniref:aldo/keto reductase n=1 Tax=unclassified Pseudoxanthomonas TaxID=2645906 RepID=UPI0008DEBAA9|nr:MULTISPECIES: aldo/keto reductase [unclassified Pseudoxanthomonas]PPJ42797.1 aldo/keto reductase [Pseudoxanthomonas sp. KAs_5_3]SFV26279.1 Predicted oxidoreductase [Pseudoxanthomonas sp. YR558]